MAKTTETHGRVKDDDPEVKVESKVATVVTVAQPDPVTRIMENFSSWYRIKKCIAWILRYRANLLRSVARRKANEVKTINNDKPKPITLQELQLAEREVLRYVQRQAFSNEIARLESTGQQQIKKTSPIYKLDPKYINGMLCVGGRLKHAPIDVDAKYPILLPKNHHVSVLIARYYHDQSGHSGIEHTLSLLRQVYWLVNARATVRRITSQCISCKKRQAPPNDKHHQKLNAWQIYPLIE